MEKRHSPMGMLRAPLGHWAIAVIFAVAAAWGMRTWLDRKAVQSARIATLSWDASAARETDPDLASATEPAVAVAQSILSDSVVARLANSANLPSSARTARIGDFRSRLELRQSSPSLLQVQFHDASPQHAVQTANAVAAALTSAPPPAAIQPAAVAPPPVETPPAAPVSAPAAQPSSPSSNALAHALSQLEGELSETQKKLNSLSSDGWERREHASEPSSYRESKQQQLLTAQVGAALRQISELRADPANSGRTQESLRRIQEALFSVWPASRAYKGATATADFRGFNAAGVNAGRLREERAQFGHAMDVVQKERAAIQRLEPAPADTPAPSASASPTAPAALPLSESSSAAAPPITETEIRKSPAEDSFRLLRPAGAPDHSPLWPVPLAGLCCGLLYLSAAGLRYRRDEDDEATYDGARKEEPSRMITPAGPARPPEFFARTEAPLPDPAEREEELAPRAMPSEKPMRSADFFGNVDARFADTRDAEEPSRTISSVKPVRSADFFGRADAPPAADLSGSAESRPAAVPRNVLAGPAEVMPPEPEVEPANGAGSLLDDRRSNIIDQEITMAVEETKRPSLDAPVGEGESDPWVDNIMKNLSETSIGRMFERTAAQDREEDQSVDPESRRLHPDRLAG